MRGFGPPEALDGLTPPPGVRAGRVAGDEVLWVGDSGRVGRAAGGARRGSSARYGNRATVVDHSDGYALFALTGAERDEVFARLSSIRIPDGGRLRAGQLRGCPGTHRSAAPTGSR